MTRKTRTFLFIFFVVLFVLVAPLTIFYSLGWRIDWQNKKIIKPGLFYFKVWPKNCQIYLTSLDNKHLMGRDGKLEKKTDFFFGSALIENLFPRKYEVEIKKEGFQSWKKTLEIKEGLPTEAKNIILVPEKPNFTVLTKNLEEFYFSPDEKKIILKDYNPPTTHTPPPSQTNWWSLKLFELERNVKSHLIEEKNVSKEKVELLDIKFSPDSKVVLLELEIKESLKYYILELDKIPLILTPLNFLDSDVEEIYFNPTNPQELFLLKSEALYKFNLKNNLTSKEFIKDIITFSIFNGHIYYLDKTGYVFKTDSSLQQKEKLNIVPFNNKSPSNQKNQKIQTEVEYKITGSGPHVFLKEENLLYEFNPDKRVFEKFFELAKNLKFSPDEEKIVSFDEHEIWVIFLEEKYDQPQKKAGEKLFLTRFSEKIDDVFWLTSHYLILSAGGKIKVVEIDDRDKINIFDLAEFKTPKMFWSQINKEFFVLSEKNLYFSEKLVP